LIGDDHMHHAEQGNGNTRTNKARNPADLIEVKQQQSTGYSRHTSGNTQARRRSHK